MAKRMRFLTQNDYYQYYIGEIAPQIERQIVADVLAGEELVADSVKEKYGVGWRLPPKVTVEARKIWHEELVKAIHDISGVTVDDVRIVLYFKGVVNRYCGGFGSKKKKRRTVGPNVTPEKYLRYYTRRIADFTCLKEEQVELYLQHEKGTMDDVIVANGYVYLLPDFMRDQEFERMTEEFVADMIEVTGLDKATVEICFTYKGLVSQLCGEPG